MAHKKYVSLFVLCCVASGLIMAGMAAPGSRVFAAGTIDNPIITSIGCTLSVEFNALDRGPYRVEFWDDYVNVYSETQNAARGESLFFLHSFNHVTLGSAFPGIIIYIFEPGVSFPSFSRPLYTGITRSCDPALNPVCNGQAVVGQFEDNTPVYWAPDHLALPATVIPTGKTAWVFGMDSSRLYYLIRWACDFLWVPVRALGPNYDRVWNGTALPTCTLQRLPPAVCAN